MSHWRALVVLASSLPCGCGRSSPPPESREVLVPAGDFIAGADCEAPHVEPGCGGALHPRARVTLPSFYADRNLVTRAEYADCVRAGACTDDVEAPPIRGTPAQDSDERKKAEFVNAIALVRQENAARYCARRAARLPTGDEFERIARGTTGAVRVAGCDDPNLDCWNASGPAGTRSMYIEQWISLHNTHFPYGAAMIGDPYAYEALKMVWPDHDANPYAAFRCVRDAGPASGSANAPRP